MSAVLTIILKYVASTLTVVLGVLGVITTVRDDQTREITRQGWTLLICIIASGIIVITLQVFEDVQKEAERDAAARKTNELLEQVIRSQYPLRDVQISCSIGVEASRLAPFPARFLPAVTAARAAMTAGESSPAGLSRSMRMNGAISSVGACRDSGLYPRPDREPFAYALVEQPRFVLRFYKTPIASAAYPYRYSPTRFSPSTVAPDLEMLFRANHSMSLNNCVEYDFDASALRLEVSDLESDPRHWRSSGRIISVPDLRGAQLFIGTWSMGSTTTNEEKLAASGLRTVRLEIGELDSLWMSTDSMTKHVADDGGVFWEYRFPATTDAILALSLRH